MNSRLRRPAGALLATTLAASILGAVPSAYAADGTISGTVTGSGVPLDYAGVQAYALEGGSWGFADNGSASVNPDGSYSLSLPPGDYRLGFRDYSGGFVEEFFADAPTVEDADTIALGDGTARTIDADLAVASHVSGTVTGSDGLPRENVNVTAYTAVTDENGFTSWQVANNEPTLADGTYNVGGLAAGTYRIGFDPFEGSGLAQEFYDDQPEVLLAQDITVAALTTVTAIDAQLARVSQITGTVTDANGAPLAGVEVYARGAGTADWTIGSQAITDADGGYLIDGLAKGTYRVEFEGAIGDDFVYEVWNNQGSIEKGDDIVVDSNVTITGKDAQLIVDEFEVKYPEGVTIPMISGTAQVGSTLTVTAGTWTPADITATYQWFNDNGPITGATGTTYVPTAADLGTSLVVLVDASYPGYASRTNMSNVVGPITAAPVVAPPVVTPPVVTPAPVPVPAPAPVISFSKKIDVAGALKVGSTLKLKNFKALVSRAAVSYKIQWYSGSKKIKKATKSKLKVAKALKGKKISVKVSATSGTTTKTVKVKVGKIR